MLFFLFLANFSFFLIGMEVIDMKLLFYILIGLIVLILEAVGSYKAFGHIEYAYFGVSRIDSWFDEHKNAHKLIVSAMAVLFWPVEVIGRLIMRSIHLYRKLRSK